jgi:hypothetical protein
MSMRVKRWMRELAVFMRDGDLSVMFSVGSVDFRRFWRGVFFSLCGVYFSDGVSLCVSEAVSCMRLSGHLLCV